MMQETMSVQRSPLDEARFGFRCARADGVKKNDVTELMSFCQQEQIKLLIARTDVGDLHAPQALEDAGCFLTDTLMYYQIDPDRAKNPGKMKSVDIRPFTKKDAPTLRLIAIEAFKNYRSHYHMDARLDQKLCDDIYADWAYRSATVEGLADEILVAERDNRPVGFGTIRVNSPQETEGVLYGVTPIARGLGVFKSLLAATMSWSIQMGAERTIYSTQLNNFVVQKTLSKLGFLPYKAYYTFHRWFDA